MDEIDDDEFQEVPSAANGMIRNIIDTQLLVICCLVDSTLVISPSSSLNVHCILLLLNTSLLSFSQGLL